MPAPSRPAAALLGTLVAACWAAAAPPGPACPGNTTVGDVVAGFNLSGQVAVVTGGDSGLGFSVARALASRGATVVIGAHNLSKGQAAAWRLLAEGGNVSALPLDLGSLSSVRRFAEAQAALSGPRLHYLVNNAGITGPSVLSGDGYEQVFEVDYLGHFLLTELLLPALRQGAPSRVVNVASGAHENACEVAGWPEGCFKDWTYLPPPVVPSRNVTMHSKVGPVVTSSSSYGVGKFLQIQHAAEITAREKAAGVTAFSMTPGFASTGMTGKMNTSDPTASMFCKAQRHPDPSLPENPCPFSADQGAAAIAYCALEAPASLAGRYFSRTWACEERPVVMHGFTPPMRPELYRRSLEWVGLAERAQERQPDAVLV